MTSPSPLRFLWAVLLMFVAVGSPDNWPMSKTFLWGIGWTGLAGVILWPLTNYAQRRRHHAKIHSRSE